MRIWSLHPKYLDTKGLVALWRETLLAKHVLEGKTKGYKNHPQLIRFLNSDNPTSSINEYLSHVYLEAISRNYHFDKEKINWSFTPMKIDVTTGQVEFEIAHLLNKLSIRDIDKYKESIKLKVFEPHPIFRVNPGNIESWEKVNNETEQTNR
jgi:hypothetical protein